MELLFALEVIADYCAMVQIHPVLIQFEDQLVELYLA